MTVKRRAKGALLVSVLAAVVVVLSIGGMPSIEALPNRVARQTHEHRRVLTGDNIFARKKDSKKSGTKKDNKGNGGKKSKPVRASTSTPKPMQKPAQKPTQKPTSNPQSRPQPYGMTTSSPTCLECDEAYLYSEGRSPVVSPSPSISSSTQSASGGGSSEMNDEPEPTAQAEITLTEPIVSSAYAGMSLIITSLSLGEALSVVMACV